MAERRWRFPGTGSLRGRLLWRLGGLLLVLLLIGSAATYWRARHAADIASDRPLLASARDIADGLYASDGTLRANVPYVALDSFEYDSAGRIFYQVIDPQGKMISGYENFVSQLDIDENKEKLNWLGTMDSSSLKMKVAASIVAISSIHLLRIFMDAKNVDPQHLMWYVIIHMTFVVSAFAMGYLDKLTKH